MLERNVEARIVVARVDRQARCNRCGELTDEVEAADLDRVLADCARERVDGALDRVRRLRSPGAAVRVGRDRVRENAGALEAVTLDVVCAAIKPRAEQRDTGGHELEVRAEADRQPHTHSGDLPLSGRCKLDLLDLVATVDRGDVAFASPLRPLDRPAEPPRDRKRERLLRIHIQLRAEPPAHVRRDHAELRLRNAEDAAERDARDVRYLRRRPERELTRRRHGRHEHRPWLDRVRDQPVLAVALAHGYLRVREQPLHLALLKLPCVAAVRAELLVHQRRTLGQRSLRIDDRWKRLVLDLDQLGRILRAAAAQSGNDGDRVARVAHLVDRQRLVLRRVGVLSRDPRTRQRAVPLVNEVGTRPRADDVGVRERRTDIHVHYARVRVRASHNVQVNHPRGTKVVHPLGLPLEKLPVLLPRDRRSDHPPDLDLDRSSHDATASIASTMFWYPVQRQMLPSSACRISASLGAGFSASRLTAARTIPLVQ